MRSKKITFQNATGYTLAARLELPANSHPHAYAIFAHVFTGSKNLSASRHISRSLTLSGIAVLRFDFTGLGDSEGNFADTNFTSNVEDLLAAARYLEEHYLAPSILVGHSLGGAAVIFAASQLFSVRAVATIGAPSEPEHVSHLLQDSITTIEQRGKATVNIGGRVFTIKKQFLDDLKSKNMFDLLRGLRKAILVMHSPQDRVVEIENAAQIYQAAYHPKSFVSLDGADHMLTNKQDAMYVGKTVSSWVSRYVEWPERERLKSDKQVVARLDTSAGFTTEIMADRHSLIADEPESVGGNDFGPDPYELLASALAACTVMTLKMYARRKKWALKEVKVHINHMKTYIQDCVDCEKSSSKIDYFDNCLEFEGDLDDTQIARLLEIAKRCPVHRTLHSEVRIETQLLENH
ncbi:MAG: bifunctional alpha/beta hydrolase/OsmC family protein [Bacteroidota bacterium]